MEYKFAPNKNYEDLSAGRVIYHKKGFSNFPARLASEIFMRCCEKIEPQNNLKIYDPCCGGGYLLTTLGFLHHDKIAEIYASDISNEAVQLASENLNLLTIAGLEDRKSQLHSLYDNYQKESHKEAISSAIKLVDKIPENVKIQTFTRNVLASPSTDIQLPLFDIIMTDVPYGGLVDWQAEGLSQEGCDNISLMVDHLAKNVKETGVIAIVSDKKQKIISDCERVVKFQVGKRKIEIFKRGY